MCTSALQAKIPAVIIKALPESWRTPVAAAGGAETSEMSRIAAVAGLSPFGNLRRSLMATGMTAQLPAN